MILHHSSNYWTQVHGSQSIEILKPLPAVSGDGWKIKKRLVGISENSMSRTSSSSSYNRTDADDAALGRVGHHPRSRIHARRPAGHTVRPALRVSFALLPSPRLIRANHRAALSTSARKRRGQTSQNASQARRRARTRPRTASPTGSCATRRRPSRPSCTGSAGTTTSCTSVRLFRSLFLLTHSADRRLT